jgi:hypothetical protein
MTFPAAACRRCSFVFIRSIDRSFVSLHIYVHHHQLHLSSLPRHLTLSFASHTHRFS